MTDLSRYTTRAVLTFKRRWYANHSDYDEEDSLRLVTDGVRARLSEIKAELSKREHVLNKVESKEKRKEAAKKKR